MNNSKITADNGFIVCIEGGDGCGKQTQARKLVSALTEYAKSHCKYMSELNLPPTEAKYIDFPNYKSDSSYFVRRFLSGAYADDLDPRTICSFYALDRFDSWQEYIGDLYKNHTPLVFDRYSFSNIIYQGVRIILKNHGYGSNDPTTKKIYDLWKEQVKIWANAKVMDDLRDDHIYSEDALSVIPVITKDDIADVVKLGEQCIRIEHIENGIALPNIIVHLVCRDESYTAEARRKRAETDHTRDQDINELNNDLMWGVNLFAPYIMRSLLKSDECRQLLGPVRYVCIFCDTVTAVNGELVAVKRKSIDEIAAEIQEEVQNEFNYWDHIMAFTVRNEKGM